MAALAGMFHEIGCTVTGSDQAAYPPMSDFLKELGIEVKQGYSPSNLMPQPDLVVVGNVIRRSNPEAIALEASAIPFTSMPGALEAYFTENKTRIVVAGTHGKTTVSSMIAWILFRTGSDPGFMIGGLPANFKKNYRLGKGPFFVLEGDEYDTAYFDKSPKFLHYFPHVAVVTSCEFDHADIYNDLEQIRGEFRRFIGLLPSEGNLVAFGEDETVMSLVRNSASQVHTYGSRENMDWFPARQCLRDKGIGVEIIYRGRRVASGTLPIIGDHNVLNAVAAIAAVHCVGVDPQKAFEALEAFAGVRRRQEILAAEAGILVIDDFAHHPTAVKVTSSGVRLRFPGRRLVAVFEPRTNTSKRAFFQQQYISAFLDADVIILREPRDVSTIPEAGRLSSMKLATDLSRLGKKAKSFSDTEGLLAFLTEELQSNDVVLIMSNGSFDNLNNRLLEVLKERNDERSVAL